MQAAQALARVHHPVVHDEARPQGADEGVQIPPALVAPVGDPLAVEPEHVDLGILGEQLLELRLHVGLDVTAEIGIAPGA